MVLQVGAVLRVPIRPSSIALMHVYVTRANFTASLVCEQNPFHLYLGILFKSTALENY